jgi:hypothetical protein
MLATVAGLPWLFDPIVDMGDPGAGALRFNASSADQTTEIAVSDALADRRNPDVSRYVGTWDKSAGESRGTLIITKRVDGPEALAIFSICGSSTDYDGWTRLAVRSIQSFGAFGTREPLAVQFVPSSSTVIQQVVEDSRVTALEEAVLLVSEELSATKREVGALRDALAALRDEARAEVA